ncbi:hypothetical protein C0033_02585 [Clostridium sp. chh4-2]|uniref:alpha/beta hydrolase n=1 Tax=Clostridium sp. chh4-2 TaxID=2067550 RepID=UPI000CCE1153|nr:alpha/beta hydrolase-fold protein [Clostridium sp. chh4-2]PNV63567.1 hypothetical protein C0033_02585 [Clostridium sp. chh4-2]
MIKRRDNIVQKRDIWKYTILSLGMLAVLSGCGNKNGLPETSAAEVEVKTTAAAVENGSDITEDKRGEEESEAIHVNDSSAVVPYVIPLDKDVVYKEGVTIEVDENSPTGYVVTFAYKDANAKSVGISSDNFYFYKENTGMYVRYTPYVWEPDMFYRCGERTYSATYVENMEKVGEDMWVIRLPLPNGIFFYQYCVDDKNIPDPANQAFTNPDGAVKPTKSVVYVPFDGTRQKADHSVITEKNEKAGEIVFDAYMDGETKRNLAVYLPYGYDANRKEAYKVIYASHGANGTEVDWIAKCGLNNIMDNLIADGKAEPAVVVCMDQTGVEDPVVNQRENIKPYIEANYNVHSDKENIAYCGLSNGGSTTAKIYLDNPGEYGYYGIWSSAQSGDMEIENINGLDTAKVMVGIGRFDTARYDKAEDFYNRLVEKGVDAAFYTENAAHDWLFWAQMYEIFVRDILWK